MTLTDADEHSPMDGVVAKRGKPITPDELKRIIEETQEHPITLGEKWFVIPSHWWSKLLKAAQERSLDDIPAIDCTSISNSTPQGFFLKSNLVEAADYQLLPEKVFNRLREIYGLVNENRDYIQREVVEKMGKRVIEVQPRVLTVSLARDSSKIFTLIIASDDNMETLKGRVLNELKVRDVPESHIRFYIEQDHEYELIEPTQQNVDAYFDTAQKVVVDIKKNDSWFILPNKSVAAFGNRHLSGSYGNTFGHDKIQSYTAGVCGLHNLGNTCFMASAIQCLSNVPALTEYFVSDRFISDINTINPLGTKGELARAYGDLMTMMWSGNYSSVQPRKLKTTIGQYAPRFGGYSQQDSQELMAYLLDGLHEDLNRVKNKPYLEEEEDLSKLDEYEHAERAWMSYKSRNDSIIVDKFHGQLKSTLVCPVCSKVSIKFDPFCFLSVPLPNKDKLYKQTIILMREQNQNQSSCGQKSWAKFAMNVTQSTTLEEAKTIMRSTLNQGSLNYVVFSVSLPSDDIKVITPKETLIREDRPRELYATILDHPAESSKLLIVKNQNSTGRPNSLPMIYSAHDNSHFTRQFLLTRALAFTKKMFLESGKSPSWSERSQNNDDSMSGCETELNDCFKLYVLKSDDSYQEVLEDGPLPLTKDNMNVVVFRWNDGTKNFNNYKGSDVIDRECGITVRKEIRLEECIDLFTKKEELEEEDSWYCPQCKKHQRASKKLELWKLPEVLIVHLKRFQYSRWTREKLEQTVQIPVRNFELNSKLANSRHEHIRYDLIAVSHHMGGMGGGHYTATGLNKVTKKWYDFNDSNTSIAVPPTDPMCNRSPYLLVFCQKNPTPDGAHADSNFEMETDQ